MTATAAAAEEGKAGSGGGGGGGGPKTQQAVEEHSVKISVASVSKRKTRTIDRKSLAAQAVDRERQKQHPLWSYLRVRNVEHGWKLLIFLSCLFCFVWIVITSFAPKPYGLLERVTLPDGNLSSWGIHCPRETVCAQEWYTLLLLAISRSSAYATYARRWDSNRRPSHHPSLHPASMKAAVR